MFNNISSLNKTGNILNMLGNRQKVIGDNMANVDTPGYTRKEISFSECLSPAMNDLEKKLNKKFGISETGVQNTGQSVNMANEIVEMQKNSLMYSVAVRNMSSTITELRTVLNVGK